MGKKLKNWKEYFDSQDDDAMDDFLDKAREKGILSSNSVDNWVITDDSDNLNPTMANIMPLFFTTLEELVEYKEAGWPDEDLYALQVIQVV
jgi:hypothetical protein